MNVYTIYSYHLTWKLATTGTPSINTESKTRMRLSLYKAFTVSVSDTLCFWNI